MYWDFVDLLTLNIYTIDNQLNMKATNRERNSNKNTVVDLVSRRNHFVVRMLPFC